MGGREFELGCNVIKTRGVLEAGTGGVQSQLADNWTTSSERCTC